MKAVLRREARRRLARLGAAELARAGRAIAARVWTLPEIRDARRLLLYASLPSEVPTDAIAREARRRGIELVYPRCPPDSPRLTLHRVEHLDELRPGRYGIREPDAACPHVAIAELDAALVPGLAWDRRGGRLGRGAGYYDRLLGDPAWRGFACGLFLAAQEVDLVPRDPWDATLDAVVTEHETWRAVRGEHA